MAKKSPLPDNVRHVIRTKHYSYSTEMTYIDWIYRYILFHDKRYLKEMDTKEIFEIFTFLAVDRKVAASTQNQALNAIVFLYKELLNIPLKDFYFKHSKSGKRIPVVHSPNEVRKIYSGLQGEAYRLQALVSPP